MGNTQEEKDKEVLEGKEKIIRAYHLTLLDFVLLMGLRKDGSFGVFALGGFKSHHNFALTTAIMMELVLRGKITVGEEKNERVPILIINKEPTQEKILNESLTYMAQFENALNTDWLKNIPAGPGIALSKPGIPNLLIRSLDSLVEKGILRKETGIFVDRYPFVNDEVMNDITHFIQGAIQDPTSPLSYSILVLYFILDRLQTFSQPLDHKRLFPNADVDKNKFRGFMVSFFAHKIVSENEGDQIYFDMLSKLFRYNAHWQTVMMAIY